VTYKVTQQKEKRMEVTSTKTRKKKVLIVIITICKRVVYLKLYSKKIFFLRPKPLLWFSPFFPVLSCSLYFDLTGQNTKNQKIIEFHNTRGNNIIGSILCLHHSSQSSSLCFSKNFFTYTASVLEW
jgi:hypothetical protein